MPIPRWTLRLNRGYAPLLVLPLPSPNLWDRERGKGGRSGSENEEREWKWTHRWRPRLLLLHGRRSFTLVAAELCCLPPRATSPTWGPPRPVSSRVGACLCRATLAAPSCPPPSRAAAHGHGRRLTWSSQIWRGGKRWRNRGGIAGRGGDASRGSGREKRKRKLVCWPSRKLSLDSWPYPVCTLVYGLKAKLVLVYGHSVR